VSRLASFRPQPSVEDRAGNLRAMTSEEDIREPFENYNMFEGFFMQAIAVRTGFFSLIV